MSKTYSLVDVKDISKEFLEMFSIFTELQEGDKLILENNKLTLDTRSIYVQPFYRWWNNQTRENITDFLELQIETYVAFINFIIAAIANIEVKSLERLQLLNIKHEHNEFR